MNVAETAPKERVNIVYQSAVDQNEDVELPLKLLVMGDFSGRADTRSLETRKPVQVDKDNFDQVLAAQQIALSLNVPNHLNNTDEAEADELLVQLTPQRLRDLEPDQVAQQVPALRRLLALREALVSLKGPLGNMPAFRKRLQAIAQDQDRFQQLVEDLRQVNAEIDSEKEDA